jgi:hypothetical protein
MAIRSDRALRGLKMQHFRLNSKHRPENRVASQRAGLAPVELVLALPVWMMIASLMARGGRSIVVAANHCGIAETCRMVSGGCRHPLGTAE